jgi:hypothetical protein
MTGTERVVPADRPSAFVPTYPPQPLPAHGPRKRPAVGCLRDLPSLEACLR